MVGDSVGARFESRAPGAIRHRYGSRAALVTVEPGVYSSVTETTAATALSLAAYPDFNGADMGSRLVAGYRQGHGYGQGTARAIARLHDGVDWTESGHEPAGRSSSGNGAACRMAAVGLIAGDDLEQLRWIAEEAAGITHSNSLACEGAVLIALAVALAVGSADKAVVPEGFLERLDGEIQLREYHAHLKSAASLVKHDPDAPTVIDRLGNNQTALGSTVTALFCVASHIDSFEDAVARACSLGGNSSAIASMAGAVSGARLGRTAIPNRWLEAMPAAELTVEKMSEIAGKLAR